MSDPRQYPILLVHGIARFDILRLSLLRRLGLFLTDVRFMSLVPDRTHYFRGIRTHLRQHRFHVEHADVGFAERSEERAPRLKATIEAALAKYEQPKVHLLGHSMGGLDSRFLLANDPAVAAQVATVATVGTPHLGTSFADHALAEWGNELIAWAGETLHLDLHGFQTLTRSECRRFNKSVRAVEAANDVVYYTYTAVQEREQIFRPLQASWDIINEHEGANDGLVSAHSQAWQAELIGDGGVKKQIRQRPFAVPADHLNQTGWWDWGDLPKQGCWPLGLWQARREREQAIKDAYLQIAREITNPQ